MTTQEPYGSFEPASVMDLVCNCTRRSSQSFQVKVGTRDIVCVDIDW
jgi:hypothetical protein